MKRQQKRTLIACAATLLLVGGTAARAADFTPWGKKAQITFSGYTGTGTLTNFPALVVLSSDIISGFDYEDCLDNGADLRFSDATGEVELPYEIEQWNPDADSYVWVKVPELVDSDTAIWAFWGEPTAEIPSYATDGSTWDETFAAVWHMNQPNSRDSTTNGNHATSQGNLDTAGVVAGGQNLNSGYLTVPNHASLNFTVPALTISALAKPTSINGESAVLRKDSHYQVGMMSASTLRNLLSTAGTTGWTAGNDQAYSTTLGAWTHYAFTYNGVGQQFYVNGEAVGSLKNVTGNISPSTSSLGLGANGSGGNKLSGSLDEIRIEKAARSADWMQAFWQNMVQNADFQTYADAESAMPEIAAIQTGAATNVTISSAWLCGNLVSTGASATAMIAYWGTTDAETNATSWAHAATLAAPLSVGGFSIQATELSADSTYYYRVAASNDAGVVWASSGGTFITGELTLTKTSDADEATLTPGLFTVTRPGTATNEALTVTYAQTGGSAIPGVNFTALSGSVTLAAGEANVTITVTPINDWDTQTDTTIILEVLPGPYILGAASTATLTIVNREPPSGPVTYHVNPVTGNNSYSVLEALAPETPWKSITYALTKVESNDVIQVSAGTCSTATGETFPLKIPAGVTLRGASIFTTILTVNAAKTAISLNAAPEAVLERLTLTGVTDTGDSVFVIHVKGGGAPLIRDVCIQGNANTRGNGYTINIENSSPTFRNCLVAGNAAGYLGRIFGATSEPIFENCTFAANWENNGGLVRDAGTPTVRDCVFWRNRYDLSGFTTANSVISNSLVQSGAFNGTNGCSKAEPGYLGGYFLPQTAAGQEAESPAVGTGSRTAAAAGLASYTTRTDGEADTGMVDLGFHFPAGTVAGGSRYVSISGSDATGDGSSGTPWRTITKAIQNATHGSVIHVAAGFYQAGESFPIKVPDGVALIGEDMQTTVIARIGGGQVINLQNASWQRVENFTVQDAGSADASCGIFIARSAPDVSHCIVRRNYGIWNGYGGIYCNASFPRMHNLLVVANFCNQPGGGIGLFSSLVELSNATIVGNNSHLMSGEGIIASSLDSRSIVRDCIVWGNGVTDVSGLSEANVLNCLFDKGSFNGTNGCFQADPLLTRGYYLSEVALGDTADSPGLNAGSRSAVDAGLASYTTRKDGVADDGAVNLGFHLPEGRIAGPALYVDIVNGSDANDGLAPGTALKTIKTALPKTRYGSVVHVAPGSYRTSTGDAPPFNLPDGVDLVGAGWTNTVIYGNGGAGSFKITGAVRSRVSGFTVRDSASGDFSGAFYLWASHLIIENCRLTANIGLRHAGGVHCADGSSPTIRNCVIDFNRINDGSTGGGISVDRGRPVIENCTIISNNVGRTNLGGGIAIRSSAYVATIRNSLIRGNGAGGDLTGVTAAMISYSHVGDGQFDGVNACFDAVPTFENLAEQDYRLTRKSPAGLDGGINLPWMSNATDMGGNPRILNKFSDVGAFETWFAPAGTMLLVR